MIKAIGHRSKSGSMETTGLFFPFTASALMRRQVGKCRGLTMPKEPFSFGAGRLALS